MGDDQKLVSRKYHCAGKLGDVEATQLDIRVFTTLNLLGEDKHSSEGYFAIFMAGLEALEERFKAEGGFTPDEINRIDLAKIYREHRQRRADTVLLAETRDKVTPDKFVALCRERDWEPDDLLAEYERIVAETAGKLSRSKDYEIFLRHTLADGESHPTDTIRKCAERVGLVQGDVDWNLMRQIAAKFGYTNPAKRGYWQWETQKL